MATPANSLTNFLRAWNITVQTSDGSTYTLSSGTNETLRVQFEIETYMLLVFWTCKLTIWNMSSQTASAIAQGVPSNQQLWNFGVPIIAGNTVTISAGYQYGTSGIFNPQTSIIYQGQVLQASWLRDDVVNSKLVLRCVTGLVQQALNFTNVSVAKNTTDLQTLQNIAKQAQIPFPDTNVDSGATSLLNKSKYPRGQALTGRPYDVIGTILKTNVLNGWVDSTGLNVRQFSTANPTPPTSAYGPIPPAPLPNSPPSTNQNGPTLIPTLLGVPEQTQYGVTFRILMDSTPKIGQLVQLAPGTIINPVGLQVGNLPPIASQNGQYFVAGIRYVGDSRGRGDDWTTEITGVVPNFFSLIQAASPNR